MDPEQLLKLKQHIDGIYHLMKLQPNYDEISKAKKEYNCFNCNEPGHFANECKLPKVEKNKNNYKCYNCHEPGHFARDCKMPKLGSKKPQPSTSKSDEKETMTDEPQTDYATTYRNFNNYIEKMKHQSEPLDKTIIDEMDTDFPIPDTPKSSQTSKKRRLKLSTPKPGKQRKIDSQESQNSKFDNKPQTKSSKSVSFQTPRHNFRSHLFVRSINSDEFKEAQELLSKAEQETNM